MADYIASLEILAEQFGRLAGVGKRTAMRLAFSGQDMSRDEAERFAQAILDAKDKIHFCPVCQNLTDLEVCPICSDSTRDHATICVVQDTKAVMSMERVREYRGVYHVLHGALSPMNGVTPDKLRLRELMERIGGNDINEIIIATNPTVEGEATAMYIARLLKPAGIKTTRLAYGIPVGGELEYADEGPLSRAPVDRREFGKLD